MDVIRGGFSWKSAAAVVLALGVGGAAHADLIVNGGAETGDLTGWVEINGGGGEPSVTSDAANVSTGTYAFRLLDDVATPYWRFRQSVTVDPAVAYTLSFDYKAVSGFAQVFGNFGNFNFQNATQWSDAGGTTEAVDNGFTRYTVTVAPADYNFIEFRATTSSGQFEGFLDNVKLVPEPASLGLMVLGVAAMVSRRHAQ